MRLILTLALIGVPLLTACDGDKSDDTDGTVTETGTETGSVDADGDGYSAAEDCDDADATINPGAEEVCDGVDNDCDDGVDSDAVDALTWYVDADADGYGVSDDTLNACEQPDGYTAEAGDCDDTDIAFNPGAVEDDCADPNDYNCDGSVGYADDDGDGWAACEECDDANSAINPDAVEICDGADNNCDGAVDEDTAEDALTWYADADTDSWGDPAVTTDACDVPLGYVADNTDCDDTDAASYPGADETCDEVDNDCDTIVDEEAIDVITFYADVDGDGEGDAAAALAACEQPEGYVLGATDCDDTDAGLNTADGDGDAVTTCDGDCDDGDPVSYPGADETCDEVDNDCDTTVDEESTDALLWYADSDADGEGDAAVTLADCVQPDGYTENATDCDDTDAGLNTADGDGDAVTTCDGDCDDDDPASYPSADEICDESDNDCDGSVDEASIDAATWYADTDEDGFGDVDTTLSACDQPDGYLSDATDCDDTDAAINTGAVEVCDDIDNDCDDDIDDADESIDYTSEPDVYPDLDADDYGDMSADPERFCEVPGGYVEDNADCDDGNSAINPGAADDEVYHDGVDQDCDGFDGYTTEDLGEGDLVITEVMNNPSAVNDDQGEWFEVYNAFGDAVDLNGLAIYDDGSNDFTVSSQLVVEAGEYVVFGISDDTATNGGVNIDYDWGSSSAMNLGNGDDELYLANASLVIDGILWDGGTDWPDLDGVAMGLAPDRMTAAENDDGESWCEAADAYGDGDLGTPGAVNLCQCVEVAYDLVAQDHTLVNYSTAELSPDIDIAAYDNGTGFDVAGWLSFDLSAIDDRAVLLDATLNVVEDRDWGVFSAPEVAVVYSEGDDWGGSDVSDAANIPRTEMVSEVFSEFVLNDWNSFEVDIAAWDWSLDLTDDALTLGVDSTRDGSYSYIYFYGSDRDDDSAYLELTVCETP